MGLSNSPAGGRSWNNIRPALPPPPYPILRSTYSYLQNCYSADDAYLQLLCQTVAVHTFLLFTSVSLFFPCCLRLCLGRNPVPRMLVGRRAGDFSSVRETKSGTVLLKASLEGRRFKWPTKVRQPTRRRSSAPQSKSGGEYQNRPRRNSIAH